MDEKTLEALRGSILKWEGIVCGTDADLGYMNCPLCDLFYDQNCIGCPVAKRRENIYCRHTPYSAYVENKSRRNAEAELEFLKSLLPSEEGRSKTALSDD